MLFFVVGGVVGVVGILGVVTVVVIAIIIALVLVVVGCGVGDEPVAIFQYPSPVKV